MTRSVEIPEAAVDAAVDVLMDYGHNGLQCDPTPNFATPVRRALEAALPYLVPAAEESEQLWPADAYPEHMAPVPAGDGGLREALVKIKGELEERSNEGEAHLFLNIPYWQLEELLAAHPAAPAVPQPVDRDHEPGTRFVVVEIPPAASDQEADEITEKVFEAAADIDAQYTGPWDLFIYRQHNAPPANVPSSAQPVDREALAQMAAEWRQSADEDERYLNRAHASEIHDVYASIRINREHADAVLALLAGEQEQVESQQ